MARRKGRGVQPALSTAELAKASGLSVWQVQRLAKMKNWDAFFDIPVRYALACGVDLKRLARTNAFWRLVANKQLKLAHLRKVPVEQVTTYFKRLA